MPTGLEGISVYIGNKHIIKTAKEAGLEIDNNDAYAVAGQLYGVVKLALAKEIGKRKLCRDMKEEEDVYEKMQLLIEYLEEEGAI
ncbi:hypothetical protein KKF61_09125 [Patescibacteria group bacterium]|nr:hypothetical protein [Patescibacteria group bacterium]